MLKRNTLRHELNANLSANHATKTLRNLQKKDLTLQIMDRFTSSLASTNFVQNYDI